MDLREIQEELFRQEYPHLLAGSDPDIERYCYLRSSGQGRQALNVYQFYIKPRYPDDVLRMALLRTYRNRDPLFPRLLAVGYRRLAERALERVRRTIDYISVKIKACDTQDVYSTIKTIEEILRFFPREQYEAVSGLERIYRYARVLDYQVKPMGQAVEMIRSYLSRSLPVLEKERKRRQQEQSRKAKGAASVDFSTVAFSKEDLKRIEIPSSLNHVEDQTLAYCVKYWDLIDDASFEQILFLYSRKYKTKNHTVYITIRQGRRANHRDEEILTSVMSLLVTGYYYSIQGDRYLQQKWREIKSDMEKAALAVSLKSAADTKSAAASRPAPAKPAVSKPAAVSGPAAKPMAPKQRAPARPAAPKPAVQPEALAKSPAAPAEPAVVPAPPVKPVPAEPAVAPAVPRPAAAGSPERKSPAPVRNPRPAAGSAPVKTPPATGSVSDRLRQLSGRGYDLYQDRFLTQARPAIRKVLGTGRGLFFTLPEKIEDMVYNYLRDHYADPYMNWTESGERRQLAEQGFELPSLNPVIDECFRRIK